MARKEALLRLHKTLVNRRSELLKRIGGDFEDLGRTRTMNASGDTADAAFDADSEEIASHLAELEARELHRFNGLCTASKAVPTEPAKSAKRKSPWGG